MQIKRRRPLQIAQIDARLADTLHGHEADHGARPLNACGIAAGAAIAVAGATSGEIGLLVAPGAGQGAHILGGNTGFLFLPFRSLRNAVFVTQNVGFPGIEPFRPLFDIVFVVKVFGNPDIGDGHGHGRVGGRLGGQPLAAQHLGRIVVVGIDMDEVDVQFLQPLAAD